MGYRENYALIDWSKALPVEPRKAAIPPARSELPFPMIVSDQIELQSQVDGKIYTSKSALRRSYRERGYVEIGNEELKPKPAFKPDRKAIRNSVGKALAQVGIPTT